tara:strand:- start:317 stop:2824 length:2508 start_codon:yes stop_codon:yes gene_type:complete
MTKKQHISTQQINSVLELFTSGNIHKTQGAIKNLLKEFPKESLLFNVNGACYAALGDQYAAIKSYKQALTINPSYAKAHYNLGGALQEIDQLDDSIKSYENAIALEPENAEAHNNLGNVFRELNQLDVAITCYEKAIAINPNYVEAHYSIGLTFHDLKQLKDTVKSYEKVLEIKPDFAGMHNNLGIVYKELGDLNSAIKNYKKAIAINSELIEVHINLGVVNEDLERFDQALICYQNALNIDPKCADALLNTGFIYHKYGQLEKAIKLYMDILNMKPDYAEAYNNLGNALMDLGQLDEAVKNYERAIFIKPDYVQAYCNQGNVFMALDQNSLADKSYKKAISINPNYAVAHFNRAELFVNLKKFNEAIHSYQTAINLNPNIAYAKGSLLNAKMHLCIWDELSININKIIEEIKSKKKTIAPFSLLALVDDPEIQKKATEIYAKDKYPKMPLLPKLRGVIKHKKIRIGYYSADFRDHPVASLTAELYEKHNRKNFEVYAFSYGPDTNDELNLRIKKGVDYFYDVRLMSHKDIIILSRSMEIDIAINLGGYTHDSRTGIFAMKVAPIQVNYLGYAGTMGVDYMHYLIADLTVIPKDKQAHYSEKIAYLPNSFMANDSKNNTSKKIFTRVDCGLPAEGFIFCCFNNHYKITPDVFKRWMKILLAVDNSVLWLAEANSIAINNLKIEAKKNNINENRIIFAPRLNSRWEHLKRIQLADLFLDTFPYNAHATTSDALQVGLPVLTFIGNSFASRVASSLIKTVGLTELITNSQEQYEATAIKLSKSPEKLKIIKDKLKNNLSKSPLYDTKLYTQHLEFAYLLMYDRYKNGLEPDHIYVNK